MHATLSAVTARRSRWSAGAAALALAALVLGYALGAGREARPARAAADAPSFQNQRVVAVPQSGTGLVVDQSSRLYVVVPQLPGTGEPKATLVVDEKGQPIYVR